MLLPLLLACTGPNTDKTEPDLDDTGVDSGDTADSGDSGDDTGDTGSPDGDVEGPDLPDCTPQSGSGNRVALSGVALAPEGPVAGYVVYDRSTGLIECVGADCDVGTAEIVCTEGVISPGLIDAHNHLQYNSLPPWQVGAEFEDRYDWRSDDRYYEYRTAYDAISDDWSCEIDKWAEARELVHGTTSVVGSYGNDCINVLIRNLDEDSGAHGVSGYSLEYSASTVTDSLDEGECADLIAEMAGGSLAGVLEHVAEGWDGSVRDEIDHMIESGCVGPGFGYVHATDATTEQLVQMAAAGTAIVWSPRSNLALYGTTTPIEIADKLGVPWAIGTDWTPSGSMAPTRELQCAAEWLGAKGDPISDVRLWEKVTTDAARIVGLDGVLGALVPGYRADLAVFDWSRTPYRGIIASEPTAVRLVVVDGQAVYGRTEWVDTLAAEPEWCEALEVCGDARSICVKAGSSGDDAQTLADIETLLVAELSQVTMPSGYEYAGELFPLFTCTEEREDCDLSEPSGGDADGDGVPDADDLCPTAYDPHQWDTDGDGEGDTCDTCPTIPDSEDCAGAAGDIDGDGVGNEDDNCPYAANADQADRDGDAVGDACDDCPDYPNPGGAGCPTSIDAIRDPSHPDHPAEGSSVRVEGAVVTGVDEGYGFFVQDPALTEFGGLYVYDRGAFSVERGDVVTVEGGYLEYYDLSEIEASAVTKTGTAAVPSPILAGSCAVGTGGADAERYESMLVAVEDVEVTDANPDDPDDYGEFLLDDCLRVDDLLWDDLSRPAVGETYARMVGVLAYSFSNSKLAPRDASDLE